MNYERRIMPRLINFRWSLPPRIHIPGNRGKPKLHSTWVSLADDDSFSVLTHVFRNTKPWMDGFSGVGPGG
ncbi:hypothetical protein P168DRAFT_291746 [Aspergillus campestris IBT 28561]|uniref:Uncharacterized protein n=1 Tax=Aspergillus campestris (strain IBT 28561) TaxID=1392248 RepID=A0A2I1CY98_ASPC2|nr:uncharacterized protein P168DRAFT_291746 [Aspergillus campestris IBT 28561]PKY02607.1 hypothetical protein P168DRAFT_291746 [Aspergillus campestris IBT 28561]